MMWESLPKSVSAGQPIGSMTYYGIGGIAEYYAQPRSLMELLNCLEWAKQENLPIAIFGCGSNSLLADGQFKGLVITLSQMTNAYWETENLLFVEAGVSNTEIAEICLDAGRSGAAWMYRMPGQLGATIRMNARCYGGEISQIAEEILTIDIHGRLSVHRGQDVFYGYKKTLLMDQPEVVIAARLRLHETAERSTLLQIMQTCEADRHRKHHFEHPSCGSTFKNNYQVGRPSGQIFDECGLKGTRCGRSEVSQFHANFIWNLGGATARDMLTLAAHMRERAMSLRNADLELEVQPIGLFDDKLFAACAMNRLGPSIEENSARWVGLLWHPADALSQQHHSRFPRPLMRFPFQSYFRTPAAGRTEVHVELNQLLSLEEAEKNPAQPFLRWKTIRTDDPKNTAQWRDLFPLSPSVPADFVDELWFFSVSEIFIAHGDARKTEYFEFEMTPEGHWIAIAFDGPRVRKPGHQVPQKSLWPQLNVRQTISEFSMDLPYELLSPLIDNGQLRVQACLSLGNEGWYLAPHWSASGSAECWDTQHKPDVKPDFHQPQRFWRVALR